MNDDVVGLLVSLAILVVGITCACKCSSDYARECSQRGGHVKSVYKGRLCLTADGRVIEWD